jgi:hypothetical protein
MADPQPECVGILLHVLNLDLPAFRVAQNADTPPMHFLRSGIVGMNARHALTFGYW